MINPTSPQSLPKPLDVEATAEKKVAVLESYLAKLSCFLNCQEDVRSISERNWRNLTNRLITAEELPEEERLLILQSKKKANELLTPDEKKVFTTLYFQSWRLRHTTDHLQEIKESGFVQANKFRELPSVYTTFGPEGPDAPDFLEGAKGSIEVDWNKARQANPDIFDNLLHTGHLFYYVNCNKKMGTALFGTTIFTDYTSDPGKKRINFERTVTKTEGTITTWRKSQTYAIDEDIIFGPRIVTFAILRFIAIARLIGPLFCKALYANAKSRHIVNLAYHAIIHPGSTEIHIPYSFPCQGEGIEIIPHWRPQRWCRMEQLEEMIALLSTAPSISLEAEESLSENQLINIFKELFEKNSQALSKKPEIFLGAFFRRLNRGTASAKELFQIFEKFHCLLKEKDTNYHLFMACKAAEYGEWEFFKKILTLVPREKRCSQVNSLVLAWLSAPKEKYKEVELQNNFSQIPELLQLGDIYFDSLMMMKLIAYTKEKGDNTLVIQVLESDKVHTNSLVHVGWEIAFDLGCPKVLQTLHAKNLLPSNRFLEALQSQKGLNNFSTRDLILEAINLGVFDSKESSRDFLEALDDLNLIGAWLKHHGIILPLELFYKAEQFEERALWTFQLKVALLCYGQACFNQKDLDINLCAQALKEWLQTIYKMSAIEKQLQAHRFISASFYHEPKAVEAFANSSQKGLFSALSFSSEENGVNPFVQTNLLNEPLIGWCLKGIYYNYEQLFFDLTKKENQKVLSLLQEKFLKTLIDLGAFSEKNAATLFLSHITDISLVDRWLKKIGLVVPSELVKKMVSLLQDKKLLAERHKLTSWQAALAWCFCFFGEQELLQKLALLAEKKEFVKECHSMLFQRYPNLSVISNWLEWGFEAPHSNMETEQIEFDRPVRAAIFKVSELIEMSTLFSRNGRRYSFELFEKAAEKLHLPLVEEIFLSSHIDFPKHIPLQFSPLSHAIHSFADGENTLPLLKIFFKIGVDIKSPFYENVHDNILWMGYCESSLFSAFAYFVDLLYFGWNISQKCKSKEIKQLLIMFFQAGATLSEEIEMRVNYRRKQLRCRLEEIPKILEKWDMSSNKEIEALIDEAYNEAVKQKKEEKDNTRIIFTKKFTAKELLCQKSLGMQPLELEKLQQTLQEHCKKRYKSYLKENLWHLLLIPALCRYFPYLDQCYAEPQDLYPKKNIKDNVHKALSYFSKKSQNICKEDSLEAIFLPIIALRYFPAIELAEHLLLLKNVMAWFGCYDEKQIRLALAIFQIDFSLRNNENFSLKQLTLLVKELGKEKWKVIIKLFRTLYEIDGKILHLYQSRGAYEILEIFLQ